MPQESKMPALPEITKDLTIPKLFYRIAQKYGRDKVAMREKEFGDRKSVV